MERKLASIQKIRNIKAIPNSDFIECCEILGWEVVSQKGLHNIGDLVIYVETDSILPETRPEFEFMRERKFRVKTIRLRKQISQGLLFPLSILPEKRFGSYKEGDDVTKILGITKYLTPSEKEEIRREQIKDNRIKKYLKRYSWYRKLFPKKTGSFPKFIKKTDEDRIQLFPNICEELKYLPLEATEKLDGQSGTYAMIKTKKKLIFKSLDYIVCSRRLQYPRKDMSKTWWQISEKYPIQKFLESWVRGNYQFVILQGEIVGPGIQGNKYELDEIDFYVFNFILPPYTIYDASFTKNLVESWGMKHVPIINKEYLLKPTIKESIEDTNLKSVLNPKVPIEGFVCRNNERNISFKMINPVFLLKYGL